MATPMPLIVMALAGGAVVIYYGAKQTKTSLASTGSSTGATTATGTGSLAKGAAGFSANQKAFASELQAKTGLDPGVIAAWMAAEEPIGATSSSGGTQDWLNVGITDTVSLGQGNPEWQNPIAAADATAQWMSGQWSDPGFGTASAGIQAILHSVGQGPQAEIAAIQNSHWASSGYPNLQQLYTQLTS
jgi:hypothetical protein